MCLIKYIPSIIALLYFLNTVLSYFCINTDMLRYLGGMSFIPLLFIYVSSFVFHFCIYHRLFLYYIFISDIVSIINIYIEVSKMHHTDTERKEVRGEVVSLLAATEVYNKYRNLLPNKTTIAGLYVALNYHYHRYINLFKQWFGDNALEKTIEASITSWFKDEDIPNGGKIWKHFKEY